MCDDHYRSVEFDFRVYAVTKANKYVIAVSGVLIASSLATGLWFVSIPSAKGSMHMSITVILALTLSAQPFKCPGSHLTSSGRAPSPFLMSMSGRTGRRSRSQVFILNCLADYSGSFTTLTTNATDFVAFVCLVVFIFKLKADQGQSRMTRLMRTLLQNGILYFFVMMGFHVAMLAFTIAGKVITSLSTRRLKDTSLMSFRPSLPLSPRLRLRCTCFAIPVEQPYG